MTNQDAPDEPGRPEACPGDENDLLGQPDRSVGGKNKPLQNHRSEAKRDAAMQVAVDGLPEGVRAAVGVAYRARGGSFMKVSVTAIRDALKEVRRKQEDAGRYAVADDLTRREDILATAAGQ